MHGCVCAIVRIAVCGESGTDLVSPYCFFASSFFFLLNSNLCFTWSTVLFSTFIDMPMLRWSVVERERKDVNERAKLQCMRKKFTHVFFHWCDRESLWNLSQHTHRHHSSTCTHTELSIKPLCNPRQSTVTVVHDLIIYPPLWDWGVAFVMTNDLPSLESRSTYIHSSIYMIEQVVYNIPRPIYASKSIYTSPCTLSPSKVPFSQALSFSLQ